MAEIVRNKKHDLSLSDPSTQRRNKLNNCARVIEELLEPGEQLETIAPRRVNGLLQARIVTLEEKVFNLEAQVVNLNNLTQQLQEVIETVLPAMQLDIEKSVPIYHSLEIPSPTTTVTLPYAVNPNTPISVIWQTLPHTINVDYTIDQNILTWISPLDPALIGLFEITYYRI